MKWSRPPWRKTGVTMRHHSVQRDRQPGVPRSVADQREPVEADQSRDIGEAGSYVFEPDREQQDDGEQERVREQQEERRRGGARDQVRHEARQPRARGRPPASRRTRCSVAPSAGPARGSSDTSCRRPASRGRPSRPEVRPRRCRGGACSSASARARRSARRRRGSGPRAQPADRATSGLRRPGPSCRACSAPRTRLSSRRSP